MAVATTVLIWGIQFPVAKGAYAAVDGFSMTLVRYGFAVLVLVLLLWWHEGQAGLLLEGQGLRIALAGGLGVAGSALLTFVGLSMTRPEIAAIIASLQPSMAAIADWLVSRRRPPGITVACITVAFAGTFVVITRGGALLTAPALAGETELLGNVLVLLGSIAFVAYSLTIQELPAWSALRVSTLTIAAAVVTISAAWAVAHASGATRVDMAVLPAVAWRLFYISALGVVVAMFLWSAGVKRIGVVNAMLLLNLMPVITFALRFFEGAEFDVSELTGAVIVVGALFANNLMLRRKGTAGAA